MDSDVESFLRDMQDVKHIFGDKWTIPIMVALSDGPMRRSEIHTMVNAYALDGNWPGGAAILHDSILTRSLRKMVAEGLIVRRESLGSFPRRVWYSLGPEAREFLRMVRRLEGWSRRNARIVANTRAYCRDNARCTDGSCEGGSWSLGASG